MADCEIQTMIESQMKISEDICTPNLLFYGAKPYRYYNLVAEYPAPFV